MPDTLTPYDLACEGRTTPLGLDEAVPRLSWKLADGRPGQRQTAYRLVIEGGGGRHDSGIVRAEESLHVVPEGFTAAPATRYAWTVTVWDADGAEGASASSWFETGLLGPEGWAGASWIEHDPALDPMMDPPTFGEPLPERLGSCPPARLYRRAFTAREAPASARLYVTARGIYLPYLNGVRVGDAELAPGWTDYRHRVQYQTYDVTELVAAGENVLGAQVSDGWWSGYLGFDRRRQAEHYGVRPQLIARLVIDYGDGGRDVVVTDAAWREHDGHVRHADLLMGEVHDARLERSTAGRWSPGYDDSAWRPVRIAGADHDTLIGMLDEPVRVTEEISPAAVTALPGGRILVDLGQNMVGRVRLRVRRAAPGTRVTLRHAEVLDESGEPYVANLRSAEATDLYIAAGESEEVYEPAFTVHGFRYVEISGHDDVDVTGRVLHSDTRFTGELVTSDPEVNRLLANIRWGQRGNFVSVPTDCPQRDERLGWLADAQVFLPTACYNADVSAFFARWLRDVIDGRHPGGAFPDVAPVVDRYPVNREGAPGWGDAGVLIPWHLYRVYGDVRTLERCFPAMAGWIDWIESGNPDLIWRDRVGNHYGDWLQIGAETPREVLATAYFAHSATLVARAADVLGRAADAERYAGLAQRVRKAFADAFVGADGSVTGDTQTAYLLALAYDLLPDELVEPAVARLVDAIRRNGDRLSTGFLGVALLCPVLSAHGHDDLAYTLLHQREFPSWMYSIRHGATTIWERWDGWTAEAGFQATEMNSFNHYSLGSVGQWLYARVAGIDQAPGSVAFRDLVIAPVPGGRLTSASARYESPRGLIATAWELKDGAFSLDVTIPPGARAVVRLPIGGGTHEIGSGTHRFTVPQGD
ncbi:alpha-L-rhamnosidase [Thermocatellispora tengchongensis]|uniref:alpha-L-rhamnosidase n=1 Tax=Thermocatellispora tengchongensis TaxID=1073253 RepID=A0A840PUI7_9ACTN|nr:alpha-L-rhamnosidase [Thermocatellispora tengchongensis]MBB5139565.1 alpha-L-rhamnosidase [Thermocatellispora tengchongensis]